MSECPFEGELLDAIASRRWPARAGGDLRAHVDTCTACADLADVAGGLLHEEDAAYSASRVPAAAAVWQRAQIRAREDAVRTAARPMGFVQGVAFTCALAVCLAVAVWSWPLLAGLVGELQALTAAVRLPSISLPTIDADASALLSNTAVQIAIGAAALFIPAAVYLALRDNG